MPSSRAHAASETIAAIDIGTNSVHLVIARMDDSGHMKVLDMDKVAVRLGQAIGPHGTITPEGILRTVETLKHMQEIASAYECKVRAVATHATREASNYHDLLDAIRGATGIKVEVIDGLEEARLVFLGMRYGLHLEGQVCLGVDIGGGSTEIIIAKDDEVRFVTSLKLGAVTLSAKHCGAKGPSAKDIKALYGDINQRLAPILAEIKGLKFNRAIASSGTAKAIASINPATGISREVSDTNGFIIKGNDLEKIVARLEGFKSPARIRDSMGIDQSRADIILAGAAILRCITEAFRVDQWISSSYGLREGLVVDTYRRSVPYRVSHAPNVRWRSVQEFSRRLDVDDLQAKAVAGLAQAIFDQSAARLLIGHEKEILSQLRELLTVAAHLHEAGKFISIPGYHKHTNYLVGNSRLMGFSQDERQFIALIARYHRKGPPVPQAEDMFELTRVEWDRLRYLSAVLRLAVALNRTRRRRVKEIHVRFYGDRMNVHVTPKGARSLDVEMQKAEKERSALERAFNVSLALSSPGYRPTNLTGRKVVAKQKPKKHKPIATEPRLKKKSKAKKPRKKKARKKKK